jgi:hypothetical protein
MMMFSLKNDFHQFLTGNSLLVLTIGGKLP